MRRVARELGISTMRYKTPEIVSKLRKYIRDGIIVVVERDVAIDCDQIVTRPSSAAQKHLPDRALIIDYRVASGLR